MKKKKKFMQLNPLGVYKLKMALKKESIAHALDAVEVIKAEKRPELKRTTLEKIEKHLIFLVSHVQLDKKIVKRHYEWLYNLVSVEDELNNKVIF